MKMLVLLALVSSSVYASEYATKGAVTEALFIIKNKQKDFTDTINELKKELKKRPVVTEGLSPEAQELEEYHNELKKLTYSASLKELEALSSDLTKTIEELSSEQPITTKDLKTKVDVVQLIKEKIALEKEFFPLLLAFDTKELDLRMSIGERYRTQKQVAKRELKGNKNDPSLKNLKQKTASLSLSISKLRREIVKDRKQLRTLRSALAKVNDQLYKKKGSQKERAYIERLTPFSQ